MRSMNNLPPPHQLLTSGADLATIKRKFKKEWVSVKDGSGQTPLHIACLADEPNLEAIQFLLSKGADPRARDVNGWTPLHSACSSSATYDLLKLLVDNGGDVKDTNTDGTSPLHYFARHSPPTGKIDDWEKALDFLIDRGAYINLQNKNGETPLHGCVFRGSHEMFVLFLKKRADINITNKHGESVLHYAVRAGKKRIVEVLLEMGMDPSSGTGVNGNPLEVGENAGNKEILEMLRKKEREIKEKESPATADKTQTTTDQPEQLKLKMLQKRRAWHIDYNELVVMERVGKGAFGAVYKALWRGTEVAMKKIHSNSMSKKDIDTFLREIHTISKLRHPNIILFLGACLQEPNICFITEFARKGDLHTVLHNEKLDWKIKLKISIDAARGLLYLHMCSPPVVHRDLKSLNLLVDESYTVKLTDFGISKSLSNHLETMNSKMGTLNWLAPEVLDCKPYSPASDVYSFGIILWEILTQQTPFSGMHNFQILSAVARGQGLPIPDDCDPDFAKLMRATWIVDAKERPSMMEVLETLVSIEKRYATPSPTIPSPTATAPASATSANSSTNNTAASNSGTGEAKSSDVSSKANSNNEHKETPSEGSNHKGGTSSSSEDEHNKANGNETNKEPSEDDGYHSGKTGKKKTGKKKTGKKKTGKKNGKKGKKDKEDSSKTTKGKKKHKKKSSENA